MSTKNTGKNTGKKINDSKSFQISNQFRFKISASKGKTSSTSSASKNVAGTTPNTLMESCPRCVPPNLLGGGPLQRHVVFAHDPSSEVDVFHEPPTLH